MPLSRSVLVAGEALYRFLKNKGDLVTSTGNGVVTLPVGTDDQVLTADSTTPDGIAWKDPQTGILTVENEGTPLTDEPNINFVGAAVTAVNDAANDRNNITFAAPLNDIAVIGPTLNTIIYGDGSNFVGKVPSIINEYYVAKNGNDTTGNGSQLFPFLTVQAALTAIGNATSNAQFVDPALRYYVVKVSPGQYTETLTIPNRPVVVLDLNAAEIVGNVTQDLDATLFGGILNTNQVVIKGNALLGLHTGLSMARVGVTGTITMNRTAGTFNFSSLALYNCGVFGGVTFNGPLAYTGFLFTDNVNISGTITAALATININLYLNNDDTPGSTGIGGTAGPGTITLRLVKNVNFTGAVVTGPATAAFRWINVTFAAAAHDFTGCTAAISTDANSYGSYFTNVPTKGSETFVLLDKARGIDAQYTPTNYTAATADSRAHFVGIDTALAARQPLDATLTAIAGFTYADGELLIGNTATGELSKATLTAGSNITITNGNGSITIASSGGGGGGGDVTGPASSVDNTVVRFDGTTGKVIQGSSVVISDTGDVSGIDDLAANVIDVGTINAATLNRTANTLAIQTTTSGNITITSADDVTIQGLQYPNADGAANRALTTDGSGVLGFGSPVTLSSTGQLVTNSTVADAITLTPYNTGSGQTGELRFRELAANGTNYVALKSPDLIATSGTYTLPDTLPTQNGMVLTCDMNGMMYWSVAGPVVETLANLTDVAFGTLDNNDIFQALSNVIWTDQAPGAESEIQAYNVNISLTDVAETRAATINMADFQFLRPEVIDYSETTTTVAAAATTTLNLEDGNVFILTQDTNITTFVFQNPSPTDELCSFTLRRVKDNTGTTRSITWPASVRWAAATAPTLTQTANAVDVLEFWTIDNGTTWYGFATGLNVS